MLRIDPRGGTPVRDPGRTTRSPSPSDGARDEIWAYGLRNPFRASFDRATGDLTIGDVGQGRAEEVDFVAARRLGRGANYGWRCYEGFQRNPNASDALRPPGPHRARARAGTGRTGFCAIIGGYVVRDPALTDLAGRYVYGDNCAAGAALGRRWRRRARATTAPVGLSIAGLSSFGEDSCGHVYATVAGRRRSTGSTATRRRRRAPSPRADRRATTATPAPPTRRRRSRRSAAGALQRVLRQKGFVVARHLRRGLRLHRVGADADQRVAARLRAQAGVEARDGGQRVRVRLRCPRRRRRRSGRARPPAPRGGDDDVLARDAAGNEATRKTAVRARR